MILDLFGSIISKTYMNVGDCIFGILLAIVVIFVRLHFIPVSNVFYLTVVGGMMLTVVVVTIVLFNEVKDDPPNQNEVSRSAIGVYLSLKKLLSYATEFVFILGRTEYSAKDNHGINSVVVFCLWLFIEAMVNKI